MWQIRIPWFENAVIDDVNDKLEHLNVNFSTVLDRHAPVKTMKIRYRQCPFVDKEIKDLMSEREKLHRLARITQLPSDWNDFYLLRNVIKKKLRDAEKVHIQREISKNYDNKNSLWKTIKKCIPRKGVSQPVYSKNLGGLTNEFNAFFISVGPNVSKLSKSLAADHNLPVLPHSCNEVRKVVQSFPSNKAPGSDKVSMRVIKDALPCILPTLTEIVNRSFQSSVFPTCWKNSEVISLVKEGDPEIPDSNHPISLLPAASKICERIALNQLVTYLDVNKKLTSHQSGNKKLHSTETLNIFMADSILESVDRKEMTALVLLDLSKAFDSIDHL